MLYAGIATPPTARFWLHNYKFLTLGPGSISHGRGEEKLKGTELMNIFERGRSSQRALKGKIVTIFVAVCPRGDGKKLEEKLH